MAQRRIGTIRIQVKRTVTVRTTVTRRVTAQRTVSHQPQIAPPAPPILQHQPREISSRSSVRYTQPEREFLGDVRDVVESDVARDRDAFLCHAWNDRFGAANELYVALGEVGVDVWFSEKDVQLGRSLARQLDAGLSVSRVGIVLVTPELLVALRTRGFADQELGALLSVERVIPVLHGVSYDDLRGESPLLAARAGLSTNDSSLAEVAIKIAESVLSIDVGMPASGG
jgi:hypothetical protein